jgi:hypothetical protein
VCGREKDLIIIGGRNVTPQGDVAGCSCTQIIYQTIDASANLLSRGGVGGSQFESYPLPS